MKNLDKTSIIGIITCIGIMILLFMRMQQRNYENQQRLQQEAEALAQAAPSAPLVVSADQPASPATPAPAADVDAAKPAPQAAEQAPADPDLPVASAARAKSARQTVTLTRNGEAVFTIDPAVGVVATEMLAYRRQPVKGVPDGNVVLGHYDYPFLALGNAAGRPAWRPLQDSDVTVSDTAVAATRLSADGRVAMTQTWTLPEQGSYELLYTVSFRNLSDHDITLEPMMLDVGALSPMMAGPGELGYGGVAFMQPPASDNHCDTITGGQLDDNAKALAVIADPNATPRQREEARESLKGARDIVWASVHTRYFMQGVRSNDARQLFPSLEASSCPSMPEVEENDRNRRFRARVELPQLTLRAHSDQTLEFTGFAGPMDLNMLAAKGIGLEGMLGVDRFFFGSAAWMGSLSKAFLNAMLWMSRFIPGPWALGFALILLTVIVKLVLWPLSIKSSRSMKRMQEIQPQLKALREKYKSDPQEMYRRQQQLFKENNVSQLGGCLPMLIQIPIFFALFNTFRGTIELRQASFLWASDLSLPDSIFTIPIPAFGELGFNPMALIMVATMLWQQAITPSGDPSQKRMMMFMSIAFTYFLYTQPSGLTLYMTVNQLLSMLQFWVIRRLDAKGGQTPASTSTKPSQA